MRKKFRIIKIVTIFALRKRTNVFDRHSSGCSSARLEYTSGGRVVASSNLVTPTKLSRDSRTFVLLSFFLWLSYGLRACSRHLTSTKKELTFHCSL